MTQTTDQIQSRFSLESACRFPADQYHGRRIGLAGSLVVQRRTPVMESRCPIFARSGWNFGLRDELTTPRKFRFKRTGGHWSATLTQKVFFLSPEKLGLPGERLPDARQHWIPGMGVKLLHSCPRFLALFAETMTFASMPAKKVGGVQRKTAPMWLRNRTPRWIACYGTG
jgi:hypothetical protein